MGDSTLTLNDNSKNKGGGHMRKRFERQGKGHHKN